MLNKAKIIELVYQSGKVSKKVEAEQIVTLIFEAIKDEVKSGGKVMISGFGIFTKSTRKGRIGRNPKTGEKLKIGVSHSAKFKISKEFKDSLK